jgi:peptide/nickel transport system ATP-binding protein
MSEPATVFEAEDLARYFDVSRPALQRLLSREPRRILRAVDGISFSIPKGTTLSLVGESGCGKSTVARMAVGLYPPTRGRALFEGVDLDRARAAADQRRRMQMIFQDPYASLNPRWRVRDIVAEPIRAFGLVQGGAARRERVAQLLTQVGLSPLDGTKYPHEFSGGQRQRISIARALSSNPDFLVCDEPTSALDVPSRRRSST